MVRQAFCKTPQLRFFLLFVSILCARKRTTLRSFPGSYSRNLALKVRTSQTRLFLSKLTTRADGSPRRDRWRRNGPALRKERRKAARVQKKVRDVAPQVHNRVKSLKQSSASGHPERHVELFAGSNDPPTVRAAEKAPHPKSILKKTKQKLAGLNRDRGDSESPFLSSAPAISRGLKDRLAADDAEIVALEKALGVHGKKKLPNPSEDDGLDNLLEGLHDLQGSNENETRKRKRHEEDAWLENKRRKAQGAHARDHSVDRATDASEAYSGSEDDEWSGDNSINEDISKSDDSFEGFDTDRMPSNYTQQARPPRENPYVAPVAISDDVLPPKYVPPSLRVANHSDKEDLTHLRRQIQGLLNRLSEANLINILGDVETLYRDYPRQHVSNTLLDLLMGLLCDPISLQDTFIILHAGFIAAIYKIIGMDFGAQVIQRIDQDFFGKYASEASKERGGKESVNLISLLAELYNFQIISSGLVYDFVRIFLGDLSETNTELLLKIIRSKSFGCLCNCLG